MTICRFCEGAKNHHEGLIGKNYNQSKIMFIAHRPDERVNINVIPCFDAYEVALSETKTGKNMKSLLNYCNLNWEDIIWTNLFKCVLPRNRNPGRKEYRFCVDNNLVSQINEANPTLIVGLGAQVYRTLFPEISRKNWFKKNIGNILKYDGRDFLVFPHPQKIMPPYCNLQRQKELFDLMKDRLKDFVK